MLINKFKKHEKYRRELYDLLIKDDKDNIDLFIKLNYENDTDNFIKNGIKEIKSIMKEYCGRGLVLLFYLD